MHQRIIQATAEEINLRGVKFTMTHLSQRLSMSKSSIYDLFHSKNDLIAAVFQAVILDMEEQEDRIFADSSLSPQEKFRAVISIVPTFFGPLSNHIHNELRSHYPQGWQLLQEYHNCRLHRLLQFLREQVQNLRPFHQAVLQELVTAGLTALGNPQFLAQNNLTYTDAIHHMADLFTYGLQNSVVTEKDGQSL